MNPHLFGEANEDDGGANADRTVVVLKPSIDAIVAALRVAGTNPHRTVTISIPDYIFTLTCRL
jgi:putative hydrolase of the HAD superfamily